MSVFFKEITDFLNKLAVRPGKLFITEDFNIHVNDINELNTRHFLKNSEFF